PDATRARRALRARLLDSRRVPLRASGLGVGRPPSIDERVSSQIQEPALHRDAIRKVVPEPACVSETTGFSVHGQAEALGPSFESNQRSRSRSVIIPLACSRDRVLPAWSGGAS